MDKLEKKLSLEAKIAALSPEILRKQFQCLLEDAEQDEDVIRKLCLKVLPKETVYGDKFGVPSCVDLVEILVDRIQQNPLTLVS